jgi:hypothetical protein
MPDLPESIGQPAFASFGSVDGNSPSSVYAAVAGITTGSAVWPSANLALYIGCTIDRPMLAQKIGVQVGTQSGNLDVGIYDERGNRLVSMGSTAVAAAGLQVLDIADTWLEPGTYFVAMCVDNTTAAFHRLSIATSFARALGVQQQAVGAVTLPNPATFATMTQSYVPAISVQCASVL